MIELSNFYKILEDDVWWFVKCIKSHGNGFFTLMKVNEEDMSDGQYNNHREMRIKENIESL